MSYAEILGKALLIVGRAHELIGAPDVVPLLSDKCEVATLDRIVVHGEDEKRCRIGGHVGIRKIFKPGNQARALRNLVRDFAVLALVLADEINRGASRGVISL